MTLKLKYEAKPDDFVFSLFKTIYGPVAQAATDTVKEAGAELLDLGRKDIASAGFGVKWQNGLRLRYYPLGGRPTIDAAAWVYHKFIHYAGIFQDGGTILGKPLLWLALPGVPLRLGRKRFTPAVAEQEGLRLFSFRSKRGNPLLGASVSVPVRATTTRKPTIAALRQGAGGGPGTRVVPIFVGIRAATITKRLHIDELADRVRGELPSIYLKKAEALGG